MPAASVAAMVAIIRHDILAALAAEAEGAPGGAVPAGVPVVSILIVSHNTCRMTLEAIASVVSQTRQVPHEIIVVDNASSDGSAAALAALGDSIRLIALDENIGFARGNNLAALEARGSHLLLLNPDTLILDAAIDRLLAFARANPSAGIWGGRTLDGRRQLDPTSVWADMTLWSVLCRATGLSDRFRGSAVLNPEMYGGWQRDSIREVDIVTGCFLLIRHDLWRRLGGFDSAFFMYGEEADLCLRARELGARPLFTPSAVIVHYGGASEPTQVGKVQKLLRAKVTLMRRHWRPWKAELGVRLLALWPWLRASTLRAVAALKPARGHAERAAMWAEVDARRADWIGGYADDGSPARSGAIPVTRPELAA